MKFFKLLLAGILSVSLISACGSGNTDDDGDTSNNDATISGTAATGAAIANKTVTAVDANGVQTTTVTSANGTYTITVDKTASPYMLKVEVNGEALFSVALEPGTRANITPMTTMAMQEVNKDSQGRYESLDTLFSSFDVKKSVITQQSLEEAVAKVNANLSSLFGENGVPNTYDFLTEVFSANGNGIDGVLDGFSVTFDAQNPGNMMIMIGEAGFSFNSDIDFSEFMNGGAMGGGMGGETLSGNWKLTISGTASGVPLTEVVINNIPAASIPTSSSGAQSEQTFNDQFGSIGSISNYSYTIVSSSSTEVVVRVQATITTAAQTINGVTIPATSISYDTTYTYTKM